MESCYTSFTKQLTSTLPQLASHFSRLGLRPDLYLVDWIMTLYSRFVLKRASLLSILYLFSCKAMSVRRDM